MWEGTMPHFEGLGGNLAVVAKASIERVAAFARDKGWKHIRLLSAACTTFKRDYHGEDADGQQVPIMTVFKLWPDGAIRLHWASELLFEPTDPGQDMRHLGTVEPLWTLFDLTPGGRPTRRSRSSMTTAMQTGDQSTATSSTATSRSSVPRCTGGYIA
jgi:predicted dithiol-disulfide oxidoreductase (DUF899 family)